MRWSRSQSLRLTLEREAKLDCPISIDCLPVVFWTSIYLSSVPRLTVALLVELKAGLWIGFIPASKSHPFQQAPDQ